MAADNTDGTLLAEPVTPEFVTHVRSLSAANPGHQLAAYNVSSVDDDEQRALTTARQGLA